MGEAGLVPPQPPVSHDRKYAIVRWPVKRRYIDLVLERGREVEHLGRGAALSDRGGVQGVYVDRRYGGEHGRDAREGEGGRIRSALWARKGKMGNKGSNRHRLGHLESNRA